MNMVHSVLDRAELCALERAATAGQRRVMAAAFGDMRTRLAERGSSVEALDCVRLPRLVHLAVRGHDQSALPLAVALTVLYVGLDLWDSVMDGELGPAWDHLRPEEVSLTAAALIGGVVPLAMLALDAPAATVLAMQRALARAFTAIAAGQQVEWANAAGDQVTAEAAMAAVEGKSGDVVALFAELAALSADAPPATVAAWAALGRALGIATQIRTDLHDLIAAPNGRDLRNGLRTLPIALALEGLEGADRDALLTLLGRARSDEGARQGIRQHLATAGVPNACALLIETQREAACHALASTGAGAPACQSIQALIDSLSLVRSQSIQGR
jgi:geranylgeranyl pyrophosphate synthase